MAQEPAISKEVVNAILFGQGDQQRFTQDTPILPEVWQLFASRPGDRHDLLITPMESRSAVALLGILVDRMARRSVKAARPAPLQSFVAIALSFDELIGIVLPLTKWARDAIDHFSKQEAKADEHRFTGEDAFQSVYQAAGGRRAASARGAPKQAPVLRGSSFEAARILTLIAAIEVVRGTRGRIEDLDDLFRRRGAISTRLAQLARSYRDGEKDVAWIWRVASNRPLKKADEHSRSTVKADAAYRVFDVRCESITWAVLDSGIDRDHPAFLIPPRDGGQPVRRVLRTYDLGLLRSLLDAAYKKTPARNPVLATCIEKSGLSQDEATRHLVSAYRSYDTKMLDWSSIEPLLRVKEPPPPLDGHGTHVAGIIGADWWEEEESPPDEGGRTRTVRKPVVIGMCPDIRLMDFRILGQGQDETEFAVIGALQLVRYLNSHNQYIVVHGVNLSLAIPHMVENYACGRTPVCDECERLVGAGVTVVAAAGNEGYHKFNTDKGVFSSYAAVSITDPGNAESVITVGSTHRREPHTYGVSYFSSRGPTGDGRMKPDLVAPGERILSTLPDRESGSLDGTSQAAPHVSAAAAMLMARYPELNRQPRRIKDILCGSATDLGRERAFQGHGLLDILRALQSF
ncbi:MAG TPA: S8 family serine peptidase [Allosphingosinicella sp.]